MSLMEQQVAVAVWTDSSDVSRYFLAYNPNWQTYALPMKKIRGDSSEESLAESALGEAAFGLQGVGLPVGETTKFLGEYRSAGRSGRDDRMKLYTYRLYQVYPSLDLPEPSGGFATRRGFLCAITSARN